jgi:hypothetical protein
VRIFGAHNPVNTYSASKTYHKSERKKSNKIMDERCMW